MRILIRAQTIAIGFPHVSTAKPSGSLCQVALEPDQKSCCSASWRAAECHQHHRRRNREDAPHPVSRLVFCNEQLSETQETRTCMKKCRDLILHLSSTFSSLKSSGASCPINSDRVSACLWPPIQTMLRALDVTKNVTQPLQRHPTRGNKNLRHLQLMLPKSIHQHLPSKSKVPRTKSQWFPLPEASTQAIRSGLFWK